MKLSIPVITSLFVWYAGNSMATMKDLSFPFLIYFNQCMSTPIKGYILFRLPQQRWKNRGDQKSEYEKQPQWILQGWVATYLAVVYCMCCLLFILILFGLVSIPTIADIQMLCIANS